MGELSPQKNTYKKEITAVVPCYNSGLTIQRTIESIKSQSHKCKEIIVVDDGSDDTITKNVLGDIKGITLITQKNLGLPSARNVGFKKASTEFIITIDADDWLEQNSLKKLYDKLIHSSKFNYAFPDLKLEGNKNAIITNEYNYFEQLSYNLIPYCILIPKLMWEKAGGYNEQMTKGFEDWEFNVRLGRLGYHGFRVPGAILHYNVSNSGMLKSKSLKHYSEIWREIKNNNIQVYKFKKFFLIWLEWRKCSSSRFLFFYFILNLFHFFTPKISYYYLHKINVLFQFFKLSK